MSQSNPSFHLIQTLRKSPAMFRCRFRPNRIASLSRGDPLYRLHYLGTEKIYSLDMEQAQGAISRLLQPRAPEKPGKPHALVVRPRYVEVKDIATGRQLAKTYLRDIAFCAVDTEHPNVFLYICKQQGPQLQLQCRVFWCSSAKGAKDITACLAQSFQTALTDLHGQGAEPNHTGEREGPSEVDGLSISPGRHADSYSVSAELRTDRWRKKEGVATPCPLRALRRRKGIPTDDTQSSQDSEKSQGD
ncbi:hypothetical protein DPEC_G00234170 [Dallia pectoralis]|uniref:Uncharacterized protein n=1 Tax=Dallia pectoralis TaxID=75939 RepID=A0ACC2FXJ6_DALPE|nr:hypothetical protein DPEC_G00234170 [Dallia pectoralis]